MGFEFNPLVWFVCKLCRKTFPDPDKLRVHKLETHLEECPAIKCVIFEETFLDHEWFPPDFHADQIPNPNRNSLTSTNPSLPVSATTDICYSNPSVPLPTAQAQLSSLPKSGYNLNNSIFENQSQQGQARARGVNETEPKLTSSASFLVEDEYAPASAREKSGVNDANLPSQGKSLGKGGSSQINESPEDLAGRSEADSPLESLSPCSSNDGLNDDNANANANANTNHDKEMPQEKTKNLASAPASAPTQIPVPQPVSTISAHNQANDKNEPPAPVSKIELVTRGTQTSASVLQYEYLETLKAYQNALDRDANADEEDDDFQDSDYLPTSFLQQSLTVPDKQIQIREPPTPTPTDPPVATSFKGRTLRPKKPKVVKPKIEKVAKRPYRKRSIVEAQAPPPPTVVKVKGKRGRPRKIRPEDGIQPQTVAPIKITINSPTPVITMDRRVKRKIPKSKPYKCQMCGASFRKQNFLLNHQAKTHGEDKKRPFKCPHCPAALTSKPGLKRHMIVHGKDTKHKCRFCGKSFNFRNVLEDHVRTHTGERPFKCQVANCEDAFSSKTALNMHTRRKHRVELGLQQFVCPTCNRAFGLKSELNYHVIQVHQNTETEQLFNVFKCMNDPCKNVYKTKEELDAHLPDCLFIY